MHQEDIGELLDSKISLHDKNRFEVKLDVLVGGSRDKEQYSVEAFFFIPRSLGVHSHTYPSAEFYGDIQNYIRFKTPVIGLRKLADESYEYSPFRRLDEALESILAGDRSDAPIVKAVHELKLLGCVVRSDVRDHVHFLLTESDRLASMNGAAEAESAPLQDNAMAFLSDLDFLVKKLRSIRPRMLDPILPARVRDAYSNLDEFVSLMVESYLTILLSRLASRPNGLPRLEEAVKATVSAEQRHRRAMGATATLVQPDGDNEEFAQRRSMLKKYISSLLYLDLRVKEGSALAQVAMSVGAAAAIGIYLFATTLAQERYSFDSFVFIGIAMTSYVFRESIKEWLKRFFTKSLAGWLTDHSADVIDPSTGEVIGRFKEAVSFVPAAAVPDDVRRARGPAPSLDADGGGEVVLKYVKRVELFPRRILEHHHRLKAINDILRFSVLSFLEKMDDPKADFLYYNPERGELEGARIARTYPVDVVLRTTADKGAGTETHIERLRLTLTRKGIKRLDHQAA